MIPGEVFPQDGDIELNQLVTVSYQGTRDNSWDQTLQRIERERALIRARAHKPDQRHGAIDLQPRRLAAQLGGGVLTLADQVAFRARHESPQKVQ